MLIFECLFLRSTDECISTIVYDGDGNVTFNFFKLIVLELFSPLILKLIAIGICLVLNEIIVSNFKSSTFNSILEGEISILLE